MHDTDCPAFLQGSDAEEESSASQSEFSAAESESDVSDDLSDEGDDWSEQEEKAMKSDKKKAVNRGGSVSGDSNDGRGKKNKSKPTTNGKSNRR